MKPIFEREYTVHVMDRRGRGMSGDGSDYSIALEADDIAAVVDSIGELTNVLGHSYGALCSLEAALRTKAIRRLVLYEPALPAGVEIVSPGILRSLDDMVASGQYEEALLLFFREVVRVPEETIDVLRAQPSWSDRIAAAHTIPRESRVEELYEFDRERFRALRTPILLLAGGDSPHFLRKATDLLHAALPNNTLVVMPGQQHVAMDSAPELFTTEVLGFLSAAD